ncbi:hypothetical protein [Streptomyces sp. NBC_00503]|uniref:hypothetical protein n=1 Tax=Streptomyces sp. NBC_00503 TaxID=2903659 RepID=UPI002E80A7D6|nr:hypothetical protein [Streptomyces sp. NBC_00503]WUD85535.1 hypothetical protein OG490_36060 [Streptomyces sp. NBC_00503]
MVRLQVELRDREQRHGDLCPATAIRPASGYADATRYLLNTLLAHKQARGLARRAEFTTATGQDVDAVLATLAARAEALEGVDQAAAATCVSRSTPQVATYAAALEQAGYPPSLFFSRTFTIDTGQIVNQGRAEKVFRGLTATNGEPMAPRGERGFGQASLSAVRGPIWRITPLPLPPPGACRSRLRGRRIRPRARRACWWRNSTPVTSRR